MTAPVTNHDADALHRSGSLKEPKTRLAGSKTLTKGLNISLWRLKTLPALLKTHLKGLKIRLTGPKISF